MDKFWGQSSELLKALNREAESVVSSTNWCPHCTLKLIFVLLKCDTNASHDVCMAYLDHLAK